MSTAPHSSPGPRTLSAALAQARRELAAQGPSSADDAAVLARLREVRDAHPVLAAQPAGGAALRWRRAAWGRWGRWGGGFALALGLVLGAILVGPPGRALAPAPTPVDVADTGFLPLVSHDEWRRALAQQAQAPVLLVPAQLPRERLALMGLPFDAARAEQPVQAELMVHPSGQLLAVRFVQ